MTAVALFDRHKGKHRPRPVAEFFRRIVAAVRREPATDGGSFWEDIDLLTSLNEQQRLTGTAWYGQPVMRDRTIDEVRREQNGLRPRKVLGRADGDVIIDQHERIHLRPAGCPWPPAEQPRCAAPPAPARPDDTRTDLRIARPYAPQPVWQQACGADVLAAEQEGRQVA